ncbi:ribosomal protein S18-alanine N-acetyltransferase [Aureibacillus halotolerans]|uniref:[Ribosomal protein bS18]-alanine N-acetyltransferase n=1 Tax=Aureibacillus halotolerans TaxID=1508390 RepID=A0A4R6TQK4_9BACI|nr:ribosomal protein S18-alanine N-acetyltransferase [Aureibacillus halotolerans]TDQ35219.1 [SSU ribosomal protein S18P]-alanine acetyltransferase [Aureibacillus halotolerans]
MQTSVTFRQMTLEDIDQVLHVEKHSFATPWRRQAFVQELSQNPYAHYVAAVHNETEVVGYCGVWIILDEAHVTNIALLPRYRGKKLGEALLHCALETVKAKGGKTVSLEVRLSNKVAQNLYTKFGFKKGGIRKGYYTDNNEDAMVMWVNLT